MKMNTLLEILCACKQGAAHRYELHACMHASIHTDIRDHRRQDKSDVTLTVSGGGPAQSRPPTYPPVSSREQCCM